jgi:serine/threonine protein kinase
MKHMLAKDPLSRYTINDIIKHDWVTANGIQPLTIKSYLPVTIEPEDKDRAIGKINVLQLIKVKIKQRILNEKKNS